VTIQLIGSRAVLNYMELVMGYEVPLQQNRDIREHLNSA
jgi:hypothetical protein